MIQTRYGRRWTEELRADKLFKTIISTSHPPPEHVLWTLGVCGANEEAFELLIVAHGISVDLCKRLI